MTPQEYKKLQNTAHTIVSNAIKYKKLDRQPCEVCGDPKSQAHHKDYAKPLEIQWLCFKHHREAHRKARDTGRHQLVKHLRRAGCAIVIVAGLAHAQSLPDTPKPSVTKRDYALASASVAGMAFDAWSTQHNLSRGCTELNPVYGPRPSSARLWIVASALTAGPIVAGWELRRHGHPKLAKFTWFMVGEDAVEHIVAGSRNLTINCQK